MAEWTLGDYVRLPERVLAGTSMGQANDTSM
jgi:hypothetical protein